MLVVDSLAQLSYPARILVLHFYGGRRMMKYCTHPDHRDPDNLQSPWILDGEPRHDHERPRMRFIDGEWREVQQKEQTDG